MHLEWTRLAIQDIKDAGDFIALDNPYAAHRMSERAGEAAEYLLRYPHMGRLGRVHGTRELVVSGTPFVVVDRVKITSIQILRVLHHAKKWPAS